MGRLLSPLVLYLVLLGVRGGNHSQLTNLSLLISHVNNVSFCFLILVRAHSLLFTPALHQRMALICVLSYQEEPPRTVSLSAGMRAADNYPSPNAPYVQGYSGSPYKVCLRLGHPSSRPVF